MRKCRSESDAPNFRIKWTDAPGKGCRSGSATPGLAPEVVTLLDI